MSTPPLDPTPAEPVGPADPAEPIPADRSAPAPGWRHDLTVAALVIVASQLAAVPIGLLWGHFADHPVYQVGGGQLNLVAPDATQLVRADALFLLITGGTGLVAAALAFWCCQRAKIGATLGLAAGGIVGGWLAWRIGHAWTGGMHPLTLALQGDGSKARLAPDLGARAVLVAWPVAALVLNAVLYAITWPAKHKATDDSGAEAVRAGDPEVSEPSPGTSSGHLAAGPGTPVADG